MAKKASGGRKAADAAKDVTPQDIDSSDDANAETDMQSDGPSQRDVWIRGFFMLVFAILFNFAQTLLVIAAIIQFISPLITRKPNKVVTDFGDQLAVWFQQVARYQTTVTDTKPFPWSKWGEALDHAEGTSSQ